MSDSVTKEETELQPLINVLEDSRESEETRRLGLFVRTTPYADQADIIKTVRRQPNGDIANNARREPPDTVDGEFTRPVETEEIFSPGKTNNYTIDLPLQPLVIPVIEGKRPLDDDEIDSTAKDCEDNEEPSFSYSNPATTEEIIESSQGPDDPSTVSCCLSRSSWIEKKFNELILAVNYHEAEKMKKILNEENPSTLVVLLTKRDKSGQPCIMKAITRQSLNCIQPLLEQLEILDFGSYNKMDALQSEGKKNIFHVAAQIVRDQAIINKIDIYHFVETLADTQDDKGTTPLILAAQYQNHLMARRLLSYKAKIDHVDTNGFSPIYWAAATGSAETLKMFLVHGVRDTTNQLELFRNHELYNGKGTIVQAIVESKCPETLQVCLEIHNGRNHIIECLKKELNDKRGFIHAVCETPLVNLVKLAIQDTEHVLKRLDDDEVTPLMKATEARQLDIVKLILSTNTGKKTLSSQKLSTRETALMMACKNGFDEIVSFMMKNADKDMDLGQLDQDSRNVFHHAAKNDKILPLMIYICRKLDKYKNYKSYLKLQDNDGYVSLHHAAASGSYENVKLLLENDVPYNTPSSRLGRTALHYAACSNVSTVKALLEFVKSSFTDDVHVVQQFIDEVDCQLQTSLHIAARLGKWQTVSYLLENGATIKCDKENETPLHLASYRGCTKTVQLLIQNNPSIINHENRVGETPAMFAAVNGQTETLQMLLDNNAKLWAQSHCISVEKRKTCLDWAVMNRRSATAMAILAQHNWKDTMKKSCLGPDGLLARMVISMPNVAMEVLNKCEEKKSYEAKYDFFALQTREELQICGKTTDFVTSMMALETMAKYSRNECLSHAVVQRFLDQKWSYRARKYYLFCLFIYIVFLISFTTYTALVTEGFRSSGTACMFTIVICLMFTILSVIKELFQVFHRRLQYFCMVSSYLDLIMYICVFIFLPNAEKSNLQRQAGAIAIFLAWINFTWFLKRFPTYGIYVIMAKKIFVTFLKVFVPISFFIIAFSMTFFMLLHKKDEGFENIVRSFLTSFAMMVGEIDYRDSFLQQTDNNFVLILLFLFLFLILMSILIMNLLTGLAVGDIGVIMKRSLAEKQIQQAMLIVDMDRYLNKYPGLGAKYVEPLILKQKRRTCATSCLQNIQNVMFPRLEIDDEKESKKQGCDCSRVKEQLNTMQNTLEELKRSFVENQFTTLPRKNREFRQSRRNTVL